MKWTGKFRFIDLFAGLGGFHLAASSLGGECVFAAEIQPELISIYENNFGLKPHGDIGDVDVRKIPRHNLLCAGFPCQPFSKAGSQLGWEDEVRGTVFFHVLKILEYHQPEFVVLENVAHFVRHDSGNTYQRVIGALRKLGYAIDSQQLSPHRFGVPQIRERMYLVGRLERSGGLSGHKWPENFSSDLDIRSVLDKEPKEARKLPVYITKCLDVWQQFLCEYPSNVQFPSFPVWSMEFGATYPYDRESLFDYSVGELNKFRGIFGQKLRGRKYEDILPLVPSYARGKRNAFPSWKKEFIRKNREIFANNREMIQSWIESIKAFPPSLQKLEWNCKGEEREIRQHLIQFRASGVRVKRSTTSPSLVAMTTTQVPIIGWENRYMTKWECARLQSMGSLQWLPKSDNAAFRALGNAVNVTVATLVLNGLLAIKR